MPSMKTVVTTAVIALVVIIAYNRYTANQAPAPAPAPPVDGGEGA